MKITIDSYTLVRKTLIVILLFGLLSCKSEKELILSPYVKEYAGQYVVENEGVRSRTSSQRYILTPTGQAELHKLEKSGGYGEFRIEELLRGQWTASDGLIEVLLEEDSESFERRVIQHDSLPADTLWIHASVPGRSLRQLVRF